MTDHLPECPMLDERYPKHPLENCDYCNMLRACEQRVSKEALQDAKARESNGITWAQAYSAALDAAQQAIRNREDGEYFPWVQVEIALAAIDALRGKP